MLSNEHVLYMSQLTRPMSEIFRTCHNSQDQCLKYFEYVVNMYRNYCIIYRDLMEYYKHSNDIADTHGDVLDN